MPGQIYLSAAATQPLYFDASSVFLPALARTAGEGLQFFPAAQVDHDFDNFASCRRDERTMATKKILMLVGDYVEDYEVMVPFQMLLLSDTRSTSSAPIRRRGTSPDGHPRFRRGADL